MKKRLIVVLLALSVSGLLMIYSAPTASPSGIAPSRNEGMLRLGRLVLNGRERSSELLQASVAYDVTTTADSGSGSLRQAILDANAHAGGDYINFSIPGSSTHRIQLSSDLPSVTDTVTIDGYTQPGASPNTASTPQIFNGTILIELRGSSSINQGLRLTGGNSTLRGLAINGFNDAGVHLASEGNTVIGNYIGTDVSGQVSQASVNGVTITAHNNVLGGSSPADRNVISGNSGMNIYIDKANGTIIKGNYIGIGATGGLLSTNAWYGLGIGSSSSTQVGGGEVGDKNVITANLVQAGFVSSVDAIPASNNVIQGNYINTTITGQSQSGYSSLYAGLGFGGNAHNNLFGGLAAGEGNVVGGNPLYTNIGIGSTNGYVPTDNSLVGNSIRATDNGLALDIGEVPPANQPPIMGRNNNDVGDGDGGGNDHLNYPVLANTAVIGSNIDITFGLDIDDTAGDNTGYRIEFFANDSLNNQGNAGGERYLGSTTILGDVTAQNVSLPIPQGLELNGKFITATTTEVDNSNDGLGSTSEMSLPMAAVRKVVVTNTNDSGAGSLRQAIIDANEALGTDTIVFQIPDSGVHSIKPLTVMPWIEESIIIDGYSQAGATPNSAASPLPLNGTLRIEIDGSNLPLAERESMCLKLRNAHNSIIKGLVINRCGSSGIGVETSNYLTITGNYIGTDTNGYNDLGNGRDHPTSNLWTGDGINIQSSNHFRIGGLQPADRNIIAGNEGNDIFFGNESNNANPSEHNVIQGNYIGVAADGVSALPAGYAYGHCNAILNGNSHHDLIGGTQPGAGNVIASSYEFGVSYRDGSSFSRLEGNLIGTDYTGTQTMTHALGTGNVASGVHVAVVSGTSDGMHLTRAPHDITIGGTTAAARNIISGNTHTADTPANGVILHEGTYNTTVIGNYIGTDISGNNALPNDGYGVTILTDNGYESHDNQVRDNLIIGSQTGQASGISLHLTPNNIVQNNTIKNFYNGISVTGNNNLIGGVGQGNTIDRFSVLGIMVSGSESTPTTGTIVQANTVTNKATDRPDGVGIFLMGAVEDSLIGGSVNGAGNIIKDNGVTGIGTMQLGQNLPNKNSILRNVITGNQQLGIDMFVDVNGDYQPDLHQGANPNDVNDQDTGPNGLLNTPEVRSADISNGQVQLEFDLDVNDGELTPQGYRVEFYANSQNWAESEIYLGSTVVAGDVNDQQVAFPTTFGESDQYWITATTTEMDNSSDGFGATSEFSVPVATTPVIAFATPLAPVVQTYSTRAKSINTNIVV